MLLFLFLPESNAQTHLDPSQYPYQFPTGNFISIIDAMQLNRPAGDTAFTPGRQVKNHEGTHIYDKNGRVVSRITYDPNGLYYKDSLVYSVHGILIKATSFMDDKFQDTAFKPIYTNLAYLKEYQYYYSVVCDTAYAPNIFCYTFDYYNQCIRTQIGNSTDTVVFENITDTGWVCKYLYRDSDTSQFYIGRIDSIVKGQRKVSLIYYRDSVGKKLHSHLLYTYTNEGLIATETDKLAVPDKAKKTQLPKSKK